MSQPRRSHRTRTRRSAEPSRRNQGQRAILSASGLWGDQSSDGMAPKGHPNVFASSDRTQGLTQRGLQLPDTDLTHVVTIAENEVTEWRPR